MNSDIEWYWCLRCALCSLLGSAGDAWCKSTLVLRKWPSKSKDERNFKNWWWRWRRMEWSIVLFVSESCQCCAAQGASRCQEWSQGQISDVSKSSLKKHGRLHNSTNFWILICLVWFAVIALCLFYDFFVGLPRRWVWSENKPPVHIGEAAQQRADQWRRLKERCGAS